MVKKDPLDISIENAERNLHVMDYLKKVHDDMRARDMIYMEGSKTVDAEGDADDIQHEHQNTQVELVGNPSDTSAPSEEGDS